MADNLPRRIVKVRVVSSSPPQFIRYVVPRNDFNLLEEHMSGGRSFGFVNFEPSTLQSLFRSDCYYVPLWYRYIPHIVRKCVTVLRGV